MTNSASAAWPRDSVPPAAVVWPAALSHVGLGAVSLVFPLLVAEAAGADTATLPNYIALAMMALGVSTLLQAWKWRGIGSGFLLPAVFTAVYLPPSLLAAQSGGLGAVAGLTLGAGVTQILLSFLVERLRPYLPTELAGLVVLMIGVILGLLGMRLMLGLGPGPKDAAHEFFAPFSTLITIVALTIWGSRRWRPIALLVGVAVGIVVHLAWKATQGDSPFEVSPVLSMPVWPLATPSLPVALIPGVLVGALACLVRASGDVIACQRATDPNWKRPDFGTIRAGVLADGLGSVAAGLIGVPGTNTYTASVGLAIATRVMARRVALAAGALWIGLGLVPGAPALLLSVPRAVLGAALFFAASFIVVTGMAIVAQRSLDARRTFAVGAALLIGTAYDSAPQILELLPENLRLFLSSSLVLGMVVGLLLNATFRAGASQQRRLAWRPADGLASLDEFAVESGRIWGARTDVINRLRGALEEAGTLLDRAAAPDGTVEITARFDEFNIDITLRWTGTGLRSDMPAAATLDLEAQEIDAMVSRAATLFLWRAADRVRETAGPDQRQELVLHYQH
jgi:xanthine/uracil permease